MATSKRPLGDGVEHVEGGDADHHPPKPKKLFVDAKTVAQPPRGASTDLHWKGKGGAGDVRITARSNPDLLPNGVMAQRLRERKLWNFGVSSLQSFF